MAVVVMMNGLMQFLHMGGYAFYVWSAYGVTALVLILNVLAARRRHASRS